MVGTAWRSWFGAAGLTIGMVLSAPALAQGSGGGLRLAAAEPRVALLLGNANYRSENSLDAVAYDIIDMEKLLTDLGFRVTALTDLNHQQLYAAATVTLPKLLREAESGVFLLYYSGHGMSYQDKGLLIPVDARITGEDSVRSSTVPVREFMEPIEEASRNQPFLGIVILDTCRHNPFIKGLTLSKGTAKGGTPSVAAPSGTIVSAATQPGMEASPGIGTRNSLYTGELLRFLGQPGWRLGEILGETALAVKERSKGAQQPWVQPGDPSLALMVLRAPTPPVQPPVLPPERSADAVPGRQPCDDFAAAPDMGFGPGVNIYDIVKSDAIYACLKAIEAYPNEVRFKAWLGRAYYKSGEFAEAITNFQPAAEGGNAEAQYHLGQMFDKGEGVTKDEAAAAGWFRKAADQGHAGAELSFSFALSLGEGVEKNSDLSLEMEMRAAYHGNDMAQYFMGDYYRDNDENKNPKKAFYWYKKSAEQGNFLAQFSLAEMLASGNGVKRNRAEAVIWFRKSADQDWGDAQYRLGEMLENGWGCRKDLKAAKQWYRKAAAHDHADAQKALRRLK